MQPPGSKKRKKKEDILIENMMKKIEPPAPLKPTEAGINFTCPRRKNEAW